MSLRIETDGVLKSGELLDGKGVVVYDQHTVDTRVPRLLEAPANLRFLVIDSFNLCETIHIVPYIGYSSYKCKCGWHDTEEHILPGPNDFCVKCESIAKTFRAVDLVVISGYPPDYKEELIDNIKKQCEECGVVVMEDY